MGEILETTSIAAKDGHAVTAIKDITYGSIAGMVGKFIEYPFDTVKVRLQTQNHFKGPLDCFTQGLRNDGITGLYRGIAPPLVGAAAENAGLFFGYTASQNVIRQSFYSSYDPEQKLPMPALVTCGAIAGAFCSLILTPIELIKCKMQVQAVTPPLEPSNNINNNINNNNNNNVSPKSTTSTATPTQNRSYTTTATMASTATLAKPRYAGPITLVSEVIKAHGILGMWHGQSGTFLRETGGSAVWFGTYEYVSLAFRNLHLSRTGVAKDETSAGEMMIAGACAGVCYNGVLFPADTIKSRMQTAAVGGVGSRQMGFWDTGKDIYRTGGFRGLYRGCGITVLRSAPASAVIFLVYETLKARF
ncbi:hypothetical protein TWF706_009286 [Orbilia oligospora]|uniref:Amino-acid transporter arg-13 n=1 Tax=Orbilia oligospora TaxID=2813651 RepID=A0A7C8P1R2_ORBOL|nr:hypothetical protein TWF706_009286 [Orbilia oligospora]KAF3123525.1 hypothetical protein TWF703_000737 [Orbilia oligospora]